MHQHFWFFVSLFLPSLAFAESIAIVDLRCTDMPPVLETQIQEKMREILLRNGYQVQPKEITDKKFRELGVPPGCMVGPCLSRVGRALQVNRAITGGISSLGSSYDLVLTMLETGGGKVLAQVSHRCDVCTFKEIEDLVVRVTEQLHQETSVYLSTQSTLTIKSDPSPAEVLLDQLPIGETPLTRIVPPGRHALAVIDRGKGTTKQEVILRPGKTHFINLRLLSSSSLVTSGPSSPPNLSAAKFSVAPWLKWTAFGASVIFSGIGGGLLALDGRETSDSRYLHDTRASGITMVGLSVAAFASAVIFRLLENPSRLPASTYKSALIPDSSAQKPQRPSL